MVRGTQTKISALIYVTVSLMLYVLQSLGMMAWTLDSFGICAGCTLGARLSYPFFHVSFLHWLVNAWCLLSIVFTYDITMLRMLVSYVIAVSFPASVFGCIVPAVGCSGLLYALLGSLSFSVGRKILWQVWWASFIAAGFFFSGVGAWLHLFCYVCGIAIGLLDIRI